MIKREGVKFVTSFRKGEAIVGIVNYKGKIIVATQKKVYLVSPDLPGGKKEIKFRRAA